MNIMVKDKSLESMTDVFMRIADGYAAMLSNPFFFRAKLNEMDVVLECDAIEDYGYYMNESENGCSQIVLMLNADKLENNIYLIAHELAHCLINNQGVGEYTSRSDGTLCLNTGVMWEESGRLIGSALEEGIADLLAEQVIERVYGKEVGRKYIGGQRGPYRFLVKMALELSKAFGKPLSQMNQLDQVRTFGRRVYFKHCYYDGVYVKHALEECGNKLWYLLATNSFHEVRVEYDRVMGSGAFLNLCIRLEEEYVRLCHEVEMGVESDKQIAAGGTDEDKARRASIEAEIREFHQKKREHDKKVKTPSDRAAAAESLKQVVRRVRRRLEPGTRCARLMELANMGDMLYAPLHEGRVWQSIPKTFEVLRGLEEAPWTWGIPKVIMMNELQPVKEMLEAGMEVVRFYEQAKQNPGSAESQEVRAE